MRENSCSGCGRERDKVVMLRHQFIVGLYEYLGLIHRNLWGMEVNELSLGKSDDLRTIMNQVSQARHSLEKIVKDPDYYGLEKLLTKE